MSGFNRDDYRAQSLRWSGLACAALVAFFSLVLVIKNAPREESARDLHAAEERLAEHRARLYSR